LSYRSNVLYKVEKFVSCYFDLLFQGFGKIHMAEIAPQRIGEFLRIVFLRLWQESAGLSVGETLAHIPQTTVLTDYEMEYIPSTHTPRYEGIVRLATIPYVRAGWLVKNKGRWLLTDEGKQACKGFTNAEAFYKESARIFEEWRENRSLLSLATQEAEENAWEQIRAYLLEMKPYEFQLLAGDLLTAMGYSMGWVAPPQKDRGFVNFIVCTDPLCLSLPRIKVHILHSGQPVLLEGLKAFLAVLGTDDVGIFISSGGFTRNVVEEAHAQAGRITLIDLEAFFDLWLEYYDRLTPAGRQRFSLKPIQFLAPME
jgi:restriction system protein